MLRQFIVGGGVSVCNIAIHALMMTIIVRVARTIGMKTTLNPSMLLIAMMSSTVTVLMITHACEVAVWALAYLIFDVVPSGAGLVYFAFVNYAGLRRHCTGGALATARPDDGDERGSVVWLVDRSHF
jgi:hypothetical protein